MSTLTPFRGYENRLVTNPGHCLVLIHGTIAEWSVRRSGAPFPLRIAFAVLPIATHARSVDALDGKRSPSALVAAHAKAPDWQQHFRQRVQKYSPLTCRAIAFGCGLGIMELTREPAIGLTVAKTSALVKYETPETAEGFVGLSPKAALNAARYLGKMAAELGPDELLNLLGWRNVR